MAGLKKTFWKIYGLCWVLFLVRTIVKDQKPLGFDLDAWLLDIGQRFPILEEAANAVSIVIAVPVVLFFCWLIWTVLTAPVGFSGSYNAYLQNEAWERNHHNNNNH